MTGDAWQQRQAFLLELSDALRPLDGPAEIQGEVTRLLRQHLAAGWCYYVEWDEEAAYGVVLRDATRDGLPSLVGTHDVSDETAFLDILRTGNILNVSDYAHFDGLTPGLRARYTALGFRSMLVATLVKQGRLVASLLLGDTEIRHWSSDAEALLMEVAERTWAAVERSRAESALRASEGLLRTLIERLPGGAVFVVDQNLRYLLAQGESLNTAGIQPAELLGRTVAQAMPPELVADYEAHYRQALAGQGFEHEHEAHGRAFITRGAPLRDGSGQIYAALAVSYDITDRKRAEQEVQALNATLEERVEERTRRVADLNTELGSFIRRTARTLEQPARLLAELLDPARPVEDGVPSFDPETLQDVLERLNSVADTLQQLSRLEQSELHLEPVALSELIQEVRSGLDGQLASVYWSVQPLPIVRADQNLLRQALAEALRFSLSPTRSPTHLEISARTDDGELLLCLQDDGLGLSPEEASTLFDLVVRTDQAVPLLPGAGLAQVRRILARHSGWAWAENHLRGGKLVLAFPKDEETHELNQWLGGLG